MRTPSARPGSSESSADSTEGPRPVFLKSLTLKGFKSFAEKTVLQVEPGITIIVGPNGSGKSNVVDALAWVLGTHAPSKVRSGQMSDVIFAGSPTRSALGRAQVEIVIDNSAGLLGSDALGISGSAQEFSEVRISREILATGENVYRINGEECRALDVQELLSDTGLGKEMHTIVGQGQLDAVLNAKPEDRRALIEEAAGILKHRRRRERATRKLEQVDGHIDKLATVLRELRRQLRPLERQAEAANKHASLQQQLRELQLQLAAHRLTLLRHQLERGARTDADVDERLTTVEQALGHQRQQESAIERTLGELAPRHERAQKSYYELTSLLERLRGTGDLIEAKRRHLIEYVEEPLAGRPPDELRAQAERLEAEREQRLHARTRARETMDVAVTVRRDAESARRQHEQELAAEARRRAEQRERILRWEGEVSALRGSIASAESETGRVAAQLQSLDGRIAEAESDVQKVQEEIQRLDASEVDLTEALETAERAVAEATGALDAAVAAERELERERASQAARAEALRAALQETAGGGSALLDAGLDGVVGLLADHVRVAPEHRTAVAAALGPAGEAVLASSPGSARRAVAWLRSESAGRAFVLAARPVDLQRLRPNLDEDAHEQLAAGGAVPLGEVMTSRGGEVADRATQAVQGALARTYLVRDFDAAVLLHGRLPDLTFVTPDGDVAGPFGYVGGAAPESSAVVTATAAEDAEQRVEQLEGELATVAGRVEQLRGELDAANQQLRAATATINESDAQITGAAERLARVHKELVGLHNQREVVAAQHVELTGVIARDQAALQAMLSRGPDAEQLSDEVDDGGRGQELDAVVEEARERELEARVELERIEEQIRHLETNAADLRREAGEVERALAEAARRREARQRGIVRCRELASFCERAVAALESSIAEAAEQRDELATQISARRAELAQVRELAADLAQQVEEVREERHAAQLRRSELNARIEQLEARIRDDFAVPPADLLAEHPDAEEYPVAELEEREDVLVRQLGMLGRVNPLALEEFKALEERHRFLSEQLEDLRASKRDLEEVIVAVDDKIREVFQAAFEDVATEFERIFARMFPGGTGRLTLTNEDGGDLLTAGVEVEARPPGKKVKRLSLLSGGERSLTVLAFVFAIFKARPSPFYVLDEVDAALDDANLQRLVAVIEEFKGAAQLIVVSHQRRTMEIADVLYGVTMGPDAVTKVVAERLEDVAELVG